MNAASFVLLSLIIVTVSYYNSKEQLLKNLSSSSRAATDFLYSNDVSKITDHFNAMGSSGIYYSVTLHERNSNRKIFESRFSSLQLVPVICSSDKSSDIVVLIACAPILSNLTLIIISLLMLSYLISVILIYRLIRRKTLLAFQLISDYLVDPEIIRDENNIKISEIEDVKTKLSQRTNQIAELSKSAALATLSRQVAHDIRSPLYALKNILRRNGSNSQEDEAVLKSLDRLNNIAQNLLEATTNPRSMNLPNYRRFQLSKVLNDLAAMKISEYPSRQIEITITCSEDVFLWFNESTLERIISNCWNNSIEATEYNKVQLNLNVSISGKNTFIKLNDNGAGFPDKFFKDLENNKIESTKEGGHGIGLHHALTSLRKSGSSINFRNTDIGAEVEIGFDERTFAKRSDPVILIDDDKYIRYSWSIIAQNLEIPFYAFPSFDAFYGHHSEIDKLAEIFVDSDLGGTLKGEHFISQFVSLGFMRLNLQTGSDASEFQDFTHLNSIVSKSFPY